MDEPRWQQFKSLFHAVVDLSEDERVERLDEACGDDTDLRDRVEQLLEAADLPEVLETAPTCAEDVATLVATEVIHPETIGVYRINGLLGEGGFSLVYRAEQQTPRRSVALKVLRPGIATSQIRRRFEFEAETLARLQHPGIAQIYEAGTAQTNGGPRSYFALELVHGKPLTDYANGIGLGLCERLHLLVQICEAVQFAHQRGVLHRDLKPANILVTDTGSAKVLDFGVARLIDADLQVTTIQTRVGQLVGTVPYMSPEQTAADPDQIDLRSDVYGLGVVAFELVTGRLPLEFGTRPLAQAMRMIQEDEPTRARMVDSGIPVEIEIILSKALEKDRERRYQSAAEVAEDINRFLDDEPILAYPPSAVYQLRKFAKRNRAMVLGAATTLLVLVVGVVTSSIFALGQYQALVAAASREAELNAMVAFQSSMLQDVDREQMGIDLVNELRSRVRASVERLGGADAADEADRDLREFETVLHAINATDLAVWILDQHVLGSAVAALDGTVWAPHLDATIRETIAKSYVALAIHDEALTLQTSAVETRRGQSEEESTPLFAALNDLGYVQLLMGQFEPAEASFREALDGFRAQAIPDERHILNVLGNLGQLYDAAARFEEAETTLVDVKDRAERLGGVDDPLTLMARKNLGDLYEAMGRYEEAEQLRRQVLESRRDVGGENHPETLVALNDLAVVLVARSRYQEAELYHTDALSRKRQILGNDHLSTIASINNMADLLHDLGRLDEAETLYGEALERARRVYGSRSPEALKSLNNLALVQKETGRLKDAEVNFRESLEGAEALLGPDHPQVLATLTNVAGLLAAMDRDVEAEAAYRDVLDRKRIKLGPEHPGTLLTINNLASFLQRRDRFGEAEVLYREAVSIARSALGQDHIGTLTLLANLGSVLASLEQYDDATVYFGEAELVARKVLGEDHPNTLSIMGSHGAALLGTGQFGEAEQLLQERFERSERQWGQADAKTVKAIRGMVTLYETWYETGHDAAHAALAKAWQVKLPGTDEDTDP